MITTENMEAALNYLAESELEWSELKATKETESKRLEITLASGIIDSGESSQAGKKVDSQDSRAYKEAVEDARQVLEHFYLIDAKRTRAMVTIEVWRSLNSSRNKGNIV
jgi:hypothetical protein